MAATGELVELLAKALRAAQRGANDRGIVSRARSGGGVLSRHNQYAPDIQERMDYPERLWLQRNEIGASRNQGYGFSRETNWNLDPEEQMTFDALSAGEIESIVNQAKSRGVPDEEIMSIFSPYQQAMLGRHKGPALDAARTRWGVDDPVARMALIGAGGVGGGLTLREALRNQWSA